MASLTQSNSGSRLPDFVIVGASRAGSTSLFRYLADHPSIFMPSTKEIRFFNRHFHRGVDWYVDQFDVATDDQVVGEATPGYMNSMETINRMAEVIPNAKLIAILRDPVDRAYSHYWMDRARGRGKASFEEYLREYSLPLDIGRYVERLEDLSRRYPRRQLLVTFYDDLQTRPHDLYRCVCRFVGVDETVVSSRVGRTVNQYVEFRSLRIRNASKRLPRSLYVVRKVIERLNTRTDVGYPPMNSDTRRRLAEYFREPNAALAEWLGMDLPPWTGSVR